VAVRHPRRSTVSKHASVASTLLALLLGAVVATPALAQPLAPDAPAARARSLFEQANEALDAGRFAEARDLLRRSMAVFPTPSAAFNLAQALRGTGETRESLAVLEALLADRRHELTAERRAEAHSLQQAIVAELGSIRIDACCAPRIELRVDGALVRAVRDRAIAVAVSVDAGTHVVTASATGRSTVERHARVTRGGVAHVDLRLAPSAALQDAPSDLRADRDDGSVLGEPWFWIAAGVVIAAGATAAFFFATSPDGDDMLEDPVTDHIVTLRAAR